VAHQPAYLPWPGYFSRLTDVDTLMLLDHVQYTERGWQNRNWIRGHDGGRLLLTVPVLTRGAFGQAIAQVRTADSRWPRAHWRTIQQVYGTAPYFDTHAQRLAQIYADRHPLLADINIELIRMILDATGLSIRLVQSTTLAPVGRRTAMLIDLCQRSGATSLRVGTGASAYLDRQALAAAGIDLEIASYSHPAYPQGRRPFLPGLSMLDAILNLGPAVRDLLASGHRLARHPAQSLARP